MVVLSNFRQILYKNVKKEWIFVSFWYIMLSIIVLNKIVFLMCFGQGNGWGAWDRK